MRLEGDFDPRNPTAFPTGNTPLIRNTRRPFGLQTSKSEKAKTYKRVRNVTAHRTMKQSEVDRYTGSWLILRFQTKILKKSPRRRIAICIQYCLLNNYNRYTKFFVFYLSSVYPLPLPVISVIVARLLSTFLFCRAIWSQP